MHGDISALRYQRSEFSVNSVFLTFNLFSFPHPRHFGSSFMIWLLQVFADTKYGHGNVNDFMEIKM